MSTLAAMLVRIRWFFLGVLATVGGGAWVLNRIVRLREQLTPRAVAVHSGLAAADALDRMAAAVGAGGGR